MKRSAPRLTWAMWTAVIVGASACNVDPYHFGRGRIDGGTDSMDADATPPEDGSVDASPNVSDGSVDACVPLTEACNGRDDDCDGEVDEGFDLAQDPANCGSCGNRCERPNAGGQCQLGECLYACVPGYVDLNQDLNDPTVSNGCEYACIPTNGGVESCDFADNDCDGTIDEGFGLDTDVRNCGSCGKVCQFLHADASCVGGVCVQGPCEPGYNDIRADVPGCEYKCPDGTSPAGTEICNGKDDDCDGVVDDGVPTGGACGTDIGECSFGTLACLFGRSVCVGGVGPTPEVCDQKDNDCDNQIDEDFDRQNDPNHCGAACLVCALPHAIEGCAAGTCVVSACEPGWVNLDGLDANGCEYACTNTGPEICDGKDNDCDGLTDLDDPSLVLPSNFCNQHGECAGTVPTCRRDVDGKTRWVCFYDDPDVEADAWGRLAAEETRCDGKDNDCDLAIDEPFPEKGLACSSLENDPAGHGVCETTGAYVCRADGAGTVCSAMPDYSRQKPEVCNGLDDDCNGLLDDGAPDEMVYVPDGNFWIYRYEASRPDATSAAAGTMSHRPCSRAGVLPWALVTWVEAKAACEAIGLRLCTAEEWERACVGASGSRYPYGDDYDPYACNGKDRDTDCGTAANDDAVMPTGAVHHACGAPPPAQTMCVSDEGVVDLSGNLKEWTGTRVSSSGREAYYIRGGAYDNVAPGLSCEYDFISAEPSFFYKNLGFRCCKTGQ